MTETTIHFIRHGIVEVLRLTPLSRPQNGQKK
jgi:hypothetical protein